MSLYVPAIVDDQEDSLARRTREQWLGLFQAQVESGLSATQFCRRRGINPNYFFQRKGELGRRPEASVEKAAGFVELKPQLPVAGTVECTPSMGMNLWGASPL